MALLGDASRRADQPDGRRNRAARTAQCGRRFRSARHRRRVLRDRAAGARGNPAAVVGRHRRAGLRHRRRSAGKARRRHRVRRTSTMRTRSRRATWDCCPISACPRRCWASSSPSRTSTPTSNSAASHARWASPTNCRRCSTVSIGDRRRPHPRRARCRRRGRTPRRADRRGRSSPPTGPNWRGRRTPARHSAIRPRTRRSWRCARRRRYSATAGDCEGATLAVTVEPCTMCAGALVMARVARLVFGAWEPKTGAVGSLWDVVRDRRLTHRPAVRRRGAGAGVRCAAGGVLRPAAIGVRRSVFGKLPPVACPSGLRSTPRKRVTGNPRPRVQIPPPPPQLYRCQCSSERY